MDCVFSFTGTAGFAHHKKVWGMDVRLYSWPVISIYAFPGYRVIFAIPLVPYI